MEGFPLLHNKDSLQKRSKWMVQRGKKVLTPLPDSKTQEEGKHNEVSLLNTLNLPLGGLGAAEVLGVMGELMQAVGAAGATAPPQCAGEAGRQPSTLLTLHFLLQRVLQFCTPFKCH